MSAASDSQLPREQVARTEALLGELDELADEAARATASEAVQALVQLYGEGLERIVGAVMGAGGEGVVRALAEDDELVSHLLVVHDLHPVDVETRVREALEGVRPYLHSHGGDVDLVGVDDEGVVRLRLRGSCDGCPSSAMTLKMAVEDAVMQAAPEVERVEAEGVSAGQKAGDGAGLIQLESLLTKRGGDGAESAEVEADWAVVGGLPQLSGGGMIVKRISGEAIAFLRIADNLYAYRDRCPVCERSLEQATLAVDQLECACGLHYDVRRAGRCLDLPDQHLEPLPLLVSDSDIVKVAMPAPVG